MRSLALEMLDQSYNMIECIRVYTDGCSYAFTRKGGIGIYIHYSNGHTVSHFIPAGSLVTKY